LRHVDSPISKAGNRAIGTQAGRLPRGHRPRRADAIWSRNRRDLTDRSPDIVRAADQQLPAGAVVDGELVILVDGRLSFDALQHRLVKSPAKVRRLVATRPASYVAFDLLAVGGVDLRTQRWSARRRRLESLADWEAYPN
jgi:ATP-dependent DNA ligase